MRAVGPRAARSVPSISPALPDAVPPSSHTLLHTHTPASTIPAHNTIIARSVTQPGVQPPILSECTQQRRRGRLAAEQRAELRPEAAGYPARLGGRRPASVLPRRDVGEQLATERSVAAARARGDGLGQPARLEGREGDRAVAPQPRFESLRAPRPLLARTLLARTPKPNPRVNPRVSPNPRFNPNSRVNPSPSPNPSP